MTTFSHPLIATAHDPFGFGHLKAVLLEPLLIAAVGLFWLAVLPIAALLCGAVALFDKTAPLQSSTLRVPLIGNNLAINPLILRQQSADQDKSAAHSSTSQAARV